MATIPSPSGGKEVSGRPVWYNRLIRYEEAVTRKAVVQLFNTLLPYFLLWFLMVRTVQAGLPYGVSLILALPAAGLLVRIFIFFHDCCHGSFVANRKVNTLFTTSVPEFPTISCNPVTTGSPNSRPSAPSLSFRVSNRSDCGSGMREKGNSWAGGR